MNWVLSTVKAVSKRQDCSLSLSVNDESSPHNRENTCYRDRIILVPGQFLWSWPTGNHCPGGRVLGCKWEGLASWGMCACAWWLRGMPLQWSLLQYVHPTPWQNPSADLVLPSAPVQVQLVCKTIREQRWLVLPQTHGFQSQCCSKNSPSSLPEFSHHPSISLLASVFAPFQTIFHKTARVIYLNIHTNVQAFHCSQPFNSSPLHYDYNLNSCQHGLAPSPSQTLPQAILLLANMLQPQQSPLSSSHMLDLCVFYLLWNPCVPPSTELIRTLKP